MKLKDSHDTKMQNKLNQQEDKNRDTNNKTTENKKEEKSNTKSKEAATEEERKNRALNSNYYDTGITYEDLIRAKDGLAKKPLQFDGTVVYVENISDTYSEVVVAMNDDYNQIVKLKVFTDYVLPEKITENILKEDKITFKGTSLGSTTYQNENGDIVTLPYLFAEYFTINL